MTAPSFFDIAQLQQLGMRITRLASDSRRVVPGDVFVAIPGDHVDARKLIPQAIAAGAAAVIWEANGFNCTHGASAYSSPCRTTKAGAVRIRHTIAQNGHSIPLYLNVVCAGKAKRAQPQPNDAMHVLSDGALVVRRYRAP